MSKYLYSLLVVLLIVAFNISMFLSIKHGQGIVYSIALLITLLTVVVFRNRKISLNPDRRVFLSLGAGGILLTIIKVEVAAAYAVIGLFILMATQFRIAVKGKPIYLLFGGNPLHKLDVKETKMAGAGLSMLISVVLTFFIKVIWLANAI